MKMLPTQVACQLLRVAYLPRATFLSRALPPHITQPALQEFDRFVLDELRKILDLNPSLPLAAQKQLRLPMRLTGFGYRSIAALANIAFYSSSTAAAPATKSVLNTPAAANTPMVRALEAAHAVIVRQGGTDTEGVFSAPYQGFRTLLDAKVPPRTKVQKLLTAQKEQQDFNEWFAALASHDQTRVRAINKPGTMLWVHALPTNQHLRMTNAETQLAYRFFLGLPSADRLPSNCACGALLTTTHAHSCHYNRNRSVRERHDQIVETVAYISRMLEFSCRIEPYEYQVDHSRRPDLAITKYNSRTMVDVSVTHPLSPSLISVRRPAEVRERQKVQLYQSLANIEGYQFYPFVTTSFGWIPTLSQNLLRSFLYPVAERNSHHSCSISLPKAFQMISVALQRGNAQVALQGILHARRQV